MTEQALRALQELLLWRWSTAVQLTSLLMIAVFFTMLGRSIRTAALQSWVRAWQCNFAALAVTLSFWLLQPPRAVSRFVIAPLYMSLKMAFVVFLIQGAWATRRPGSRPVAPTHLAAGLLGYGLAAALFVRSLDQIGVVQHTLMGVLLVGAGIALLVELQVGLGWLAAGFLARGLLCFAEAWAYVLQLAPGASSRVSEAAATFRSAASSFDSAAEWLLALGCVLAVSEWVQRELLRANAELLIAQEDVRKLADRDPLTGLANRRGLAEVFRAAQPGGATLLFFDLDEFKKINDRHGHAAGDEALRRFAAALRESFRPSDSLVRYAGDEFLVVAAGLDPSSVADRLQALRDRLRRASSVGTPIAFSVGVAEMPPGGQPDAALARADEAMYEAKRRRRPGVARLA